MHAFVFLHAHTQRKRLCGVRSSAPFSKHRHLPVSACVRFLIPAAASPLRSNECSKGGGGGSGGDAPVRDAPPHPPSPFSLSRMMYWLAPHQGGPAHTSLGSEAGLGRGRVSSAGELRVSAVWILRAERNKQTFAVFFRRSISGSFSLFRGAGGMRLLAEAPLGD